jgi:hypothetical protein
MKFPPVNKLKKEFPLQTFYFINQIIMKFPRIKKIKNKDIFYLFTHFSRTVQNGNS